MLTEHLSQLLNTTQELQQLLEQEKLCLKEKSFNDLNTILFNKQKLLQSITSTNKLVSTAKNLQTIQQDNTLSTLKKEIELRLKECKKNNEINGQLVEMSMKSNKHLMQLLTLEKGKNSVTYDQKGTLNAASLLGRNIVA